MLLELRIRDLGVIAEAVIDLSPGLTVVTGETGTGKTMVVTGLNLLRGERARPDQVRRVNHHDAATTSTVVEGRYSLSALNADIAHAARDVLEQTGGELDDDGTVIALRTVRADGRSRAHLGGRAVPAGALSQFTERQLTIHGQNDQLGLLKGDRQRQVVDAFDVAITPLRENYQRIRKEWVDTADDLERRQNHSRELRLEAQRLRIGLEEIAAVAPVAGEDVHLSDTIRRLMDADSLRESARLAHDSLVGGSVLSTTGDFDSEEFDGNLRSGGRGERISIRDPLANGASGGMQLPGLSSVSASDLLGQARDTLMNSTDTQLSEIGQRLDDALSTVADVASELVGYLSALPEGEDNVEGLLSRQAELKALIRKFSVDIGGVLQWAQEAQERLTQLDVSDDSLKALSDKVDSLASELSAAAVNLSQARRRSADKLSRAVTGELASLAMKGTRLHIVVRHVPAKDPDGRAIMVDGTALHAGIEGIDEVQFSLSEDSRAHSRPLAKAASGGELSRVMLALEVVLGGQNPGTTMVFDEVDAGVGGRAAIGIGRRLARLAQSHQVIVVTHLPQVAAFADAHIVVTKSEEPTETMTARVEVISETDRPVELARMLAGLGDTKTGHAHAVELLEAAQVARKEDR